MNIWHHLMTFGAMFEPTSLLAIFQFWSTFWLIWTKIQVNMNIEVHLKSFRAMFELTSLLVFFQFWSTFWPIWTKILNMYI